MIVSSSSYGKHCKISFLNNVRIFGLCTSPRYCGISDPSWSEIYYFAEFLSLQLEACEKSVYCDEMFVGDTLYGLKGFVVKFMIIMSRVNSCFKATVTLIP